MEERPRKITFLSWARHVPRSKGIASALHAKDYYIEYMKGTSLLFLPLRYLVQAVKTCIILFREKPRLVIAMNPPILLPLIVYLFTRFRSARYVIDSHTGAFIGKWSLFLQVHKYLARRALVTIVTNDHLKQSVDSWGARAIVLEDKLPDFPVQRWSRTLDRPSVCFISSFAQDEPLENVLLAAACVPDCLFYVTGRLPKRQTRLLRDKPANVVFTGFLAQEKYIELLNKVDAVMVLVTNDYTMLCGAYEAVAVQKPLITSDWPVLKQYFHSGTLYVDNSPKAIELAVSEVLEKQAHLAGEMKELKKELNHRWGSRLENLRLVLATSVKC
jgi:glycosyltransferase involved in cell wall biosynthesis